MIPPVKAEFSRKPKKLMECVRDELRLRHYSYRTEETYSTRQFLVKMNGVCWPANGRPVSFQSFYGGKRVR